MIPPPGVQMDSRRAESLQQISREQGVLAIWTVTHGTKDLGDLYVARMHLVGNPERVYPNYLAADTLDALRVQLPHGLTRLPRDPNDDPVILEAWL